MFDFPRVPAGADLSCVSCLHVYLTAVLTGASRRCHAPGPARPPPHVTENVLLLVRVSSTRPLLHVYSNWRPGRISTEVTLLRLTSVLLRPSGTGVRKPRTSGGGGHRVLVGSSITSDLAASVTLTVVFSLPLFSSASTRPMLTVAT